MTDLFQTKEEQLKNFCRDRHYVSKADIMEYGLRNYYIRADRTVRSLVNKGIMKRLNDDECVFRGFKSTRMAYYEWVG